MFNALWERAKMADNRKLIDAKHNVFVSYQYKPRHNYCSTSYEPEWKNSEFLLIDPQTIFRCRYNTVPETIVTVKS